MQIREDPGEETPSSHTMTLVYLSAVSVSFPFSFRECVGTIHALMAAHLSFCVWCRFPPLLRLFELLLQNSDTLFED